MAQRNPVPLRNAYLPCDFRKTRRSDRESSYFPVTYCHLSRFRRSARNLLQCKRIFRASRVAGGGSTHSVFSTVLVLSLIHASTCG